MKGKYKWLLCVILITIGMVMVMDYENRLVKGIGWLLTYFGSFYVGIYWVTSQFGRKWYKKQIKLKRQR